MAKFADYVEKQQDQLEIDAGVKLDIPESVVKRFDGKSREEIMKSFAELEQFSSRQGNDLGALRKTVDQLLELQSQQTEAPVQEEEDLPNGITTDDLYDDPDRAVTGVVKRESKKTLSKVEKLEEQLQTLSIEKEMNKLNSKFDGWQDEINTPEFVNWVTASGYRQRQFVAANQYDWDAANDLLEAWYERKNGLRQSQQRQNREKEFQAATLESSSPPGADIVETYSRTELLEKRIAAKAGNREAQRWLAQHGPSITAAYSEGRITD